MNTNYNNELAVKAELQKKITIALALGWKWKRRREIPPSYAPSVWLFDPNAKRNDEHLFEECDLPADTKSLGFAADSPNWFGDLNTCHELEKQLTPSEYFDFKELVWDAAVAQMEPGNPGPERAYLSSGPRVRGEALYRVLCGRLKKIKQ